MKSIFPPFNFSEIFYEPWMSKDDIIWNSEIILMGFLISFSCGLIGTFLVLRKLALMGDAISHSILPGIVLAIIAFQSTALIPMFLGACIAGLACSFCIEWLQRKTHLKPDAALGLTFTSFFALGILLISQMGHHVHIDAECLLYGEIGMTPLAENIKIGSINFGPRPIFAMLAITIVLILLIIIFYKQLVITSFDEILSNSIGIPVKTIHYALMFALAITIVSALESVGVILVVAMLVFPSTTASLFSTRLPVILFSTFPLALLYSIGGFFFARWMDCSIAGAMASVAFVSFLAIWLISNKSFIQPIYEILAKNLGQKKAPN